MIDSDVPRALRALLLIAPVLGGHALAQQAGAPSEPGGLRAAVYSTTAAELFWQRSFDADGPVVGYDIARDGVSLGTRDVLSLFVDDLVPGVAVRFELRAVDADGLRSAPAVIEVETGAGPGPADRPDPPAHLRAEVHSDTAVELFWARDAPGARYEVAFDGAFVGATDGTSLFLDGLSGGGAFAVVAVAPSGERSEPTTVTVELAGPSNPNGGRVPAAPAGARIEVYSATAAELFFDRAAASERVVATEIRRDGQPLGRTAGTSYFDDTRAPGARYRYELVAIDAAGIRSSATSVGEADTDDPEPPAAPVSVLSLDNLDSLLANVVALLDDNPAMRLAPLLASLVDPDAEVSGRTIGATDLVLGPDPAFAGRDTTLARTSVACTAGGGYRLLTPADSVYRIDVSIEFDDCRIGDVLLDGDVDVTLPYPAADRFAFEFLGVRVERGDAATLSDLRGGYVDVTARVSDDRPRDSLLIVDDLRYTRRSGSGETRAGYLFTNAADFTTTDGRTSLLGGFDVVAPWSGDGLTARVRLAGAGVDSDNYTVGRIELIDRSDNTLTIDADDGDPATYSAISTVDGVTTSATLGWTPSTSPACTSVPDGPEVLARCTRRPVRLEVGGRR